MNAKKEMAVNKPKMSTKFKSATGIVAANLFIAANAVAQSANETTAQAALDEGTSLFTLVVAGVISVVAIGTGVLLILSWLKKI